MRKAFAALAFLGWALGAEAQYVEDAKPVLVAADVSLRNVLREIGAIFTDDESPEVPISISFAASGVLREKIEEREVFDLFIAASPNEIVKLSESGHLQNETVRLLAENRIVFASAWPADLSRGWPSMVKLDWKRIAIASEQTSMSGMAARQMFNSEGIAEFLRGRVEVYPDSERVIGVLKRAKVNAAVIYQSDAVGLRPSDTFSFFPVARTNYPDIAYSGAVLQNAMQPDLARRFLNFLASTNAEALWLEWGFELPSVDRTAPTPLPAVDSPGGAQPVRSAP